MKILIIIGVSLIVLIVLIYLIGFILPRNHSATITSYLNVPIDSVWKRISKPEEFISWRKEIKKIDVISSDEWIETNRQNDKIPIKITETIPYAKLVTVINSSNLLFGGTWTYNLKQTKSGTEITIIENGEVYNPFFRFFSKFVFGHTATIKNYLANLETSFKN